MEKQKQIEELKAFSKRIKEGKVEYKDNLYFDTKLDELRLSKKAREQRAKLFNKLFNAIDNNNNNKREWDL